MSASTSISSKGLLIRYDYCTGCHACEVACKREHDYGYGHCGISVMQYGPSQEPDGTWDYFYIPVTTDLCDLCIDRLEAGKLPSCVHNCQAKVMEYGDVEDLARKMAYIKKCVLFSPGPKDQII